MKEKGFIDGFKVGFKEFGEGISAIINSVLLSVVYFIGVGTSSVYARIKGKRFLDTMPDKKDKTYWTDLNLKKEAISKYYRQF